MSPIFNEGYDFYFAKNTFFFSRCSDLLDFLGNLGPKGRKVISLSQSRISGRVSTFVRSELSDICLSTWESDGLLLRLLGTLRGLQDVSITDKHSISLIPIDPALGLYANLITAASEISRCASSREELEEAKMRMLQPQDKEYCRELKRNWRLEI